MDRKHVFISHASSDKPYAQNLKNCIEQSYVNTGAFVSSDPFDIPSGSTWVDMIIESINQSDACVIVLSHNARDRVWIGFEAGYYRCKNQGHHMHVLRFPDVEIPSPINVKQAKDMTDVSEMQSFFEGLSSDLDREFQGSNSYLAHLVNSAYEDIPNVTQTREFEIWKTHLRQRDRWAKETLIHVDKRERRVWTFLDDMSFQIEELPRENIGHDVLPWARNQSLNTDGSNPTFRGSINLNVSGVTVKQFVFYSWDNSRYLVPGPESHFTDPGNVDEVTYYYDRNGLSFLIGKVIAEHPHIQSLEDFAHRCSIHLIDMSQ